MFTINEPKLSREATVLEREYKIKILGTQVVEDEEQAQKTKESVTHCRDWKDWLREPTFYVHGFIYMFARIAINVTMTM